eukprot:835777-Rhodomonas_salina.1
MAATLPFMEAALALFLLDFCSRFGGKTAFVRSDAGDFFGGNVGAHDDDAAIYRGNAGIVGGN